MTLGASRPSDVTPAYGTRLHIPFWFRSGAEDRAGALTLLTRLAEQNASCSRMA